MSAAPLQKMKNKYIDSNVEMLLRYGHIGTLNRGMGHGQGMGPQTGFINPGHGTLGRPPKPSMQGYST